MCLPAAFPTILHRHYLKVQALKSLSKVEINFCHDDFAYLAKTEKSSFAEIIKLDLTS